MAGRVGRGKVQVIEWSMHVIDGSKRVIIDFEILHGIVYDVFRLRSIHFYATEKYWYWYWVLISL